jgi:hypothetical protein
LQATAEPIHRPSHHYVEFALRGVSAKPVELRALIAALGAGNAVVLVDLDNFAAHSASNLAQFALLIGRGLVQCRNPKIENRPFHGIPLVNMRPLISRRVPQNNPFTVR